MVERYNLTTDLLDRHVDAGRGNREAARCGSRRATYRELLDLVGRVGNGIRSQGIPPGERVLILLPDSVEFAAAYLGAMRVGAVAVLGNPALRRSEFELFLRASEPTLVVADASIESETLAALTQSNRSPPLVTVGGPLPTGIEWETWLAASTASCAVAPTAADDPAFWLWTSGSTGHPRPVVHRHRDWRPCIDGYAKGVLGMSEADVCFSAAKAFHAYGLGNGTVFPLAVGARTVYQRDRPTPEANLAHLTGERPTLFFGVPTMYAALLSHLDHARVPDLASLRYCVSAGEPLPGELYRRWRARFGVEILDGIGSTEALHIYLSARPGRVRPGSTGSPVDGYEVRVAEEQGNAVPPGRLGDLWVRGRSLAAGYWQGSGIVPLRRHDDWFVTGDKFYADTDGYFWYVGRADDMFKSRAEWVAPAMVESALIEHPAVLESGVIGRADADGLLRPSAFVVLKPGVAPSVELEADLRRSLNARLPPYAVPYWIQFIPELPKSSTGKLLRYQLRDRERPQVAPSAPTPSDHR